MTPALLFFLLVGPFFAVLCAWIYVVWPRRSPFEDMAHQDRRVTDQAHKR